MVAIGVTAGVELGCHDDRLCELRLIGSAARRSNIIGEKSRRSSHEYSKHSQLYIKNILIDNVLAVF